MQPTRSRDRRYQVFISSTFTDLSDERKAAIEAVFERGHIPIALERFSPSNASDLEVIKKAMDDSQVYILICGHRYGEIVPGTDISYTEFEFDLAQERKLTTLVFLMSDALVAEKRRALDPANARDDREMRNHERLRRFREEKISNRFRKYFTPGPEFKYLVQLALSDALRNSTEPGFVLEPKDPTLVDGVRNEFIGAIVSELKSFEKLYERLEEQKEKKRAAAQFFAECYGDRIVAQKVSLFFESGSTVCFVAQALSDALRENVVLAADGSPSIQISTNNVLAYLLLWLNARNPCTKFPWSPPVETTYGAAYGGLEKLMDQLPDYRQPPLDLNAWQEIDRLLSMPFSLTKVPQPSLLLGAASGLQLSDEPNLLFPDDALPKNRKEELTDQLRHCKGPHVGSYHNKIFKRFMYRTGLPIVVFMTSDKIDAPIEVGKCHFILDRDYPWQQFASEHPVAFCIGSDAADMGTYRDVFRNMGFHIIDQNTAARTSAFIARNEAFLKHFEVGQRQ